MPDGIAADDQKDDLKSDRHAHEAVIILGMRDGGRIILPDFFQQKILGKKDYQTVDAGGVKCVFSEFHSNSGGDRKNFNDSPLSTY
jgi:hypothetical protein